MEVGKKKKWEIKKERAERGKEKVKDGKREERKNEKRKEEKKDRKKEREKDRQAFHFYFFSNETLFTNYYKAKMSSIQKWYDAHIPEVFHEGNAQK